MSLVVICVAVAVIADPGATAGTEMAKLALPEPLVTAFFAPRKCAPSPTRCPQLFAPASSAKLSTFSGRRNYLGPPGQVSPAATCA